MIPRAPPEHIVKSPLALSLLAFGTPLALGMGLQVTFNLVDAFLVSRLEPEVAGPALGAIGICDQVAALGSIISYGISTATAAVMSHRQGRGDTKGARRVAWQSTLVVLALGLVFGLAGIGGGEWLIKGVIGAQGRVAILADHYLRVILGGNFTIFLLLHLTTMQRALGSSKTPVSLLLASNLINLLLAVILVYGPGPAPSLFAWGPPLARSLSIPRMGLVGAAWATVLARLIVLVPLITLVVRRFGLFRREVRGPLDGPLLRQLWKLSWPTSTQLVVRISAMLFVHSLVARYYTTPYDQSATTALGVVFRLETMALFVGLGWGSAAHTFLGQNLGAGLLERAKRAGWLATGYNALMMIGLALLLVGGGESIVGFFDRDPRVLGLALDYLEIVAPSYLGLGVGIVLGSAIQGAGAPRTALRLDMIVLFGLLLPLAALVTWLGGSLGSMWRVIAVAYFVFAIFYSLVYWRGRFFRAIVV